MSGIEQVVYIIGIALFAMGMGMVIAVLLDL